MDNGHRLYQTITDPSCAIQFKIDQLNAFKTHVKREFVELSCVPKYFDALIYGLSDSELALVSFSSLCHLIKRVSMQDSAALAPYTNLVLPELTKRMNSSEGRSRSSARKALEAYWLSCGRQVELWIVQGGLHNDSLLVRNNVCLFILELMKLNPGFLLKPFLEGLVKLLAKDRNSKAQDVIGSYYIGNKHRTEELLFAMETAKVPNDIATGMLSAIDKNLAFSYKQTTQSSAFSSKESSVQPADVDGLHINQPADFDLDLALKRLLGKITGTAIDNSGITPRYVRTGDELLRISEGFNIPFTGRESEANWRQRQENIVLLRRLVAGNVCEEFADDFILILKDISDCISLAALSLRTTLSVHACQLIKEMSVKMGRSLDPIADALLTPLRNLTSSTKKIATLTAFSVICVLLSHISWSVRIFNHCVAMFKDKNTSPRLYSATFLHIFLLRFPQKLEAHQALVEEWIQKGINDPQVTVREPMRDTFWVFYRLFPDRAKHMLGKMTIQVKKALDKNRPRDVNVDGLVPVANASSALSEHRRRSASVKDFIAKQQRATSEVHPPLPSYAAPTRASIRSISDSKVGAPHREPLGREATIRENIDFTTTFSREVAPIIDLTSETKSKVTTSDGDSSDEVKHMLKCLSIASEQQEGLSILNNLLIISCPLPTNMSSVLEPIAIKSPTYFKPLLKTSQFYGLLPQDLLMKMFAVNEEPVKLLLNLYDEDKILRGITKTIDDCKVLTEYAFFHLKYRRIIFNFCFQSILDILVTGYHVYDSTLESLMDSVFAVYGADLDSNLYESVVRKLRTLNLPIFEISLDKQDETVQSIINSFFRGVINEDQTVNGNLLEMTMVNPGAILNKEAPVADLPQGRLNEMTMIIPNLKDLEEVVEVETVVSSQEEPRVPADNVHDIFKREDTSTMDIDIECTPLSTDTVAQETTTHQDQPDDFSLEKQPSQEVIVGENDHDAVVEFQKEMMETDDVPESAESKVQTPQASFNATFNNTTLDETYQSDKDDPKTAEKNKSPRLIPNEAESQMLSAGIEDIALEDTFKGPESRIDLARPISTYNDKSLLDIELSEGIETSPNVDDIMANPMDCIHAPPSWWSQHGNIVLSTINKHKKHNKFDDPYAIIILLTFFVRQRTPSGQDIYTILTLCGDVIPSTKDDVYVACEELRDELMLTKSYNDLIDFSLQEVATKPTPFFLETLYLALSQTQLASGQYEYIDTLLLPLLDSDEAEVRMYAIKAYSTFYSEQLGERMTPVHRQLISHYMKN